MVSIWINLEQYIILYLYSIHVEILLVTNSTYNINYYYLLIDIVNSNSNYVLMVWHPRERGNNDRT